MHYNNINLEGGKAMARGKREVKRLVISGTEVKEPEGGFKYRDCAQQGGLWLTVVQVQPAILGQVPCVLGGKAALVPEGSVRREVQDPRTGAWTTDFVEPGKRHGILEAVRRECGARKGMIPNSPKDSEAEAWEVAIQALEVLLKLGHLLTPTQNAQLKQLLAKLETGQRVHDARLRHGVRWEDLYSTLNPRAKAPRANTRLSSGA